MYILKECIVIFLWLCLEIYSHKIIIEFHDRRNIMFICITKGKQLLSCFLILTVLITGICTYASVKASTASKEILVPILMYHSVLKDPDRSGEYIVTPSTLEYDMIYLRNNGYETVLVKDLIAYVYEDAPLPEKPIVLTFDDGHYNNMVYLLPLLEKYQMKAVISVVGSYTEQFSKADGHNPNYSYLTWGDIKNLEDSGRIEIANHTYDLHEKGGRKGCNILKGETIAEYRNNLKSDLVKLQSALKEKSGIQPSVTFTYPFGYICPESQKTLEETGFFASLSCYERINQISKNKGCLYMLGRYNRPEGISTEEFMKKIKLP